MTASPSERIVSSSLRLTSSLVPFVVLLLFLSLGELIRDLFHMWIPGSVLGMLALSAALWTGAVKVGMLERTSDLLLANLGLFFVCPGVEIVNFLSLLEEHWLSLSVAIVGSSLVTLMTTGVVSEAVARINPEANVGRQEHKGHKERKETEI